MRIEIIKILACSKGAINSSNAFSKYLFTTDCAPLLNLQWGVVTLLSKSVIQWRDKKK